MSKNDINHIYPGNILYGTLLAIHLDSKAKLIGHKGVSYQVTRNGNDFAFHRTEPNSFVSGLDSSLNNTSIRSGKRPEPIVVQAPVADPEPIAPEALKGFFGKG